MKKYLKMSDVFVVDGDADFAVLLPMSVRPEYDDCVTPHDYATHAVNSHDELVAEVAKLKGDISSLILVRDAAREFFNCTVASGGTVKVSSSDKKAIDAANSASDWLESELRNTIRFNKGA